MAGKCSVVMCMRSSLMAMNKNSGTVSTADVIATYKGKIVLIERLKFPYGLALPGGHVERGEHPMHAAMREFCEETGLMLLNARFVARHEGKHRDPRYASTRTRVYAGRALGEVRNETGHTKVCVFSKAELRKLPKERFAFDHHKILMCYLQS